MNKYEFLYKLNKALVILPVSEKKDITRYYDELIQDAIDNGENESDFIDRLGSIETIVRTMQKDTNFVNNVKEKQNFELKKVFNITSKIIGYAIYGLIVFVIGTVAFSMGTAGLSVSFLGVSQFVIGLKNAVSDTQLLYLAGQTLVGIGLVMLSGSLFWWLINKSKNKLEKLIELVQKTTERSGEKE